MMTTYINSKYSLLRFQKELLVYAYIKEYCTESFKTTPIEIIQLCDKYLIFGLTEKINDTLIILKRIINKSNIQTQKQPIITLKQQPSFLQNGKLRDYQLTGLNWLIERQNINLNCILCDEMGLGKTIQCISLLAYNLECKNINIDNKPYLLIVPLSTLRNWNKEINTWCPKLNIFALYGTKSKRKKQLQKYLSNKNISNHSYSFNICITTYEISKIESKYLNKINWFYIIFDEAHILKSQSYSRLFNTYKSLHRLAITGTPLLHNIYQLFSFLNILLSQLFESKQSFDELFNLQPETIEYQKVYMQFVAVLKPIMLRRLKKDISVSNAKKIVLYAGMSELQISKYKSIINENISVLKDVKMNTTNQGLLKFVLDLQKVCNHPLMVHLNEANIINDCGKLYVLNKLLVKIKENGLKCVIVSKMKRMVDIFEEYCSNKGYKYYKIDGSTHRNDRDEQIKQFNDSNDKFIFLLTTRCGGVGLNLNAADCLIMYDLDWNKTFNMQIENVINRIGQCKKVKIFQLITKDTIEEGILEMQKMNKNVLSVASNNDMLSTLILKYGVNKISQIIKSTINMYDKDIDNIF